MRGVAIEERRRARTALYFSRIAQARLQWRLNDVTAAGKSLAKCLPQLGCEDRRGWEWHHLRGLLRTPLYALAHCSGAVGGGVTYSPDGHWIVSVLGGHPAHDDHPGEVRAWDARTVLVRVLRVPGALHRLAFQPDGRLALAGTDGTVSLWDLQDGKELCRRELHTRAVAAVAFSAGGKYLATAGWDRKVKVCDALAADSGRVLHSLSGHRGRVHALAFHPTAPLLASGSWDRTVRLWDAAAGRELKKLEGHKSAVYGVVFSPNGERLASAGSNGNIRVWDVTTGRVVQSVTGTTGAVLAIAFSPDGRYLAYGGGDATVRVWDVEFGVERVVFRGHTAPVESLCFSPDGCCLVSLSPAQGAIKVWDLTRHPEYATFARTRGSEQKLVRVWDLTRRPTVAVSARTGPDIEGLAFDRAGRYLFSVTVGGKLQTWEAATGLLKEERRLPICTELFSPAVIAAFGAGGKGPVGGRLAARLARMPGWCGPGTWPAAKSQRRFGAIRCRCWWCASATTAAAWPPVPASRDAATRRTRSRCGTRRPACRWPRAVAAVNSSTRPSVLTAVGWSLAARRERWVSSIGRAEAASCRCPDTAATLPPSLSVRTAAAWRQRRWRAGR